MGGVVVGGGDSGCGRPGVALLSVPIPWITSNYFAVTAIYLRFAKEYTALIRMRGHESYPAILLVLIGAIVVCGCIATDGDDDRISANGTVTYVDLEGGFYGIVTDDGERYLPDDLPAGYRIDGLPVRFSADLKEDTAGIQQWGTPIAIRDIEPVCGARVIAATGTVTHVDLEGGFYGIVADDGERYLPMDLDEAWLIDGERVTFAARILDGVMTIQQWGTPVEIVAIDRIGNATFIAASGTVSYINLEGGFYGIIADGGEHYLPIGLEGRYHVDGMRLTFAGRIVPDAVTIQQWGTPIEILDIPWTCPRRGLGGGVGLANPAAVWCAEQGHTYEIRKNPDGSEYGVCIFANGTEIDAWDYYRQTH